MKQVRYRLPSIPSALKFRQTEAGWNQTEMAEKLGISRGHYSEILSGKRGLSYVGACRAYALGVPASVLLAIENRSR